MDLKLQLWLIQAAFLVHKSPLPTLVNNSNFSESHPWQSTGGVKDTATSCRDRSSRATGDGGQTSVRQRFGRVSVVRPPTRGSGWKIGQGQWVEKLHTHMHTPQVFRGKKKQAHCVLDIVTLWNVNVVIPANLCKTHQYLNGSFFMSLQTIDTSYYGDG